LLYIGTPEQRGLSLSRETMAVSYACGKAIYGRNDAAGERNGAG
jgi:hypothetical protein